MAAELDSALRRPGFSPASILCRGYRGNPIFLESSANRGSERIESSK